MREFIDDYFIKMANLVGTRSTCDRGHVGCVFVLDKQVVSSGYAGSPRNTPHCDEVGHEMENNHCVRSTHAEINGIVNAAKNGVKINMSTLYISMFPCYSCAKAIVNAGVLQVVSEYDSTSSVKAKALFDYCGINYSIINKENKQYDK